MPAINQSSCQFLLGLRVISRLAISIKESNCKSDWQEVTHPGSSIPLSPLTPSRSSIVPRLVHVKGVRLETTIHIFSKVAGIRQAQSFLPANEQGSSENDGRSDVYDRLEFKVISNCCNNNCFCTNCRHFIWVYLNLSEFTWICLIYLQ